MTVPDTWVRRPEPGSTASGPARPGAGRPQAAAAEVTGARPRWIRLALLAVAAGVLGLVFLAYSQPALMQHLADQLWACF